MIGVCPRSYAYPQAYHGQDPQTFNDIRNNLSLPANVHRVALAIRGGKWLRVIKEAYCRSAMLVSTCCAAIGGTVDPEQSLTTTIIIVTKNSDTIPFQRLGVHLDDLLSIESSLTDAYHITPGSVAQYLL